jgi:hypothetical protein
MHGTISTYNIHNVGSSHLTESFLENTGNVPSSRSRLLSYKTLLNILLQWSLLRCCLCSQSKVCRFLSRYTDSMKRDSAFSVSVSRSSASGLNSKSYHNLCFTNIPQSIQKAMEQRMSGSATFRWQETLSCCRLHSTIRPKFAVQQKCKSYRKQLHVYLSCQQFFTNLLQIHDSHYSYDTPKINGRMYKVLLDRPCLYVCVLLNSYS